MYELPVTAKVCSVCGSKRLKRLFNAIGVIGTRALAPERDWRLTSDSALRRSDALLTDGFDAAASRKSSSAAVPSFAVGGNERRINMPQGREFHAPSHQQVAASFGLAGKGAPMAPLDVMREIRQDKLSVPSVLHQMNRRPVPTVELRGRNK